MHDVPASNGDWNASREWQAEAQKRFHDPLVVSLHGRTEGGEWCCFPQNSPGRITVEAFARNLHALYPDRDIVLVICNEDGKAIHIPHVWYATHNVWMRPTASLYPWEQDERKSSPTVGDIWHFVN
jgi:hypothetical protein